MRTNYKPIAISALIFIFSAPIPTLASATFKMQVRGEFLDYNHPDRAFPNQPNAVDFGTVGDDYYLNFGNQAASIIYYFHQDNRVYKVMLCGYKCNPQAEQVIEKFASGSCQIKELDSGRFNVSYDAIDDKGKRYQDSLLNTVRKIY